MFRIFDIFNFEFQFGPSILRLPDEPLNFPRLRWPLKRPSYKQPKGDNINNLKPHILHDTTPLISQGQGGKMQPPQQVWEYKISEFEEWTWYNC